MSMLLKDLTKNIIDINLIDKKFHDIKIENISFDSRNIKPQSLFIAIAGFKSDGHDFIDLAIENNAIAILCDENYSYDIKKNEDICFIKVSNTRKYLAPLASNFYDNPTRKLSVVGVTGTNGKTTTTYLIKSIIEANDKKSSVIGTIKNIIDNEVLETALTTPDTIQMQDIFSKSVMKNVDTAIMEASSHALELHRCDEINYDAVIFSNITEDHLDHHQTMEKYLDSKLIIFDLLKKSCKKDKFAIVNIHTDYFDKIKNYIEKLDIKLITFGFDKNCDYYAEIISMDIKKIEYKLYVYGEYYKDVSLKLLGDFNVLNSLSALAYAFEKKFDKEKSIKAIETIQVDGRFEIVTNEEHDFIVAVDYSHTPDSLKNILQSARVLKPNRIIVVFGCGGNRDRLKRPIMANIALENSDIAILTLDNQRSEAIEQIMADIEEGFKVNEKSKNINPNFRYKKIIDRKDAIFEAIKEAKKNDIVIIAGKGHETYQIFADKTIHFDDREVAREALSKL